MNLAEQVEDLKARYTKIMKENPEVFNLDFCLQQIPLADLKAYAKENRLDIEYNAYHNALRVCICMESGFLGQIVLISKKVKVEKPIVAEYVEFDEDAHYAAAKQLVRVHAESYRH